MPYDNPVGFFCFQEGSCILRTEIHCMFLRVFSEKAKKYFICNEKHVTLDDKSVSAASWI